MFLLLVIQFVQVINFTVIHYKLVYLTVDDRESHLLKVNINGKIKNPSLSVQDLENYNEQNVIFEIPAKSPEH